MGLIMFLISYSLLTKVFSALWLLLHLIFIFSLSTPLQARISKNKAYFMPNRV